MQGAKLTVKNKLTLLLPMVILSIFTMFYQSCKKADELVVTTAKEATTPQKTTEQFFELPANSAPVLHRVANELKRQNNTKEFITAFISKEGFPIWNKARIEVVKRKSKNTNSSSFDGGGLSDTIVFVPLVVSAQQYVHGFIKAIIADTVVLKIYRQNDYVYFPFATPATSASATTAESFATGIMQMDKDVFGSTEFKVQDKRLFHNSTTYNDTAGTQVFIKLNENNSGGGESFANGTTVSNLQSYEECYTKLI